MVRIKSSILSIFLILILSTSLYSISEVIEKPEELKIVKDCTDLYSDYMYYINKSKEEDNKDLSTRWIDIALKYKEHYDNCVNLVKETKSQEKRKIIQYKFYRSNPYQQQIQK